MDRKKLHEIASVNLECQRACFALIETEKKIILLGGTQFGLKINFSDWFGTKCNSDCFQNNLEKCIYNSNSVSFDKILEAISPCVHIHRETFSKSYFNNQKSDCIYYFPIDLEPNGRPRSKLIIKWYTQSNFGLT